MCPLVAFVAEDADEQKLISDDRVRTFIIIVDVLLNLEIRTCPISLSIGSLVYFRPGAVIIKLDHR